MDAKGQWPQPLWAETHKWKFTSTEPWPCHTLPMESTQYTFSIIALGFTLVLNEAEFLWDTMEEVREFKKVVLNTF